MLKKRCKTGKPCGYSCIGANKTCRSELGQSSSNLLGARANLPSYLRFSEQGEKFLQEIPGWKEADEAVKNAPTETVRRKAERAREELVLNTILKTGSQERHRPPIKDCCPSEETQSMHPNLRLMNDEEGDRAWDNANAFTKLMGGANFYEGEEGILLVYDGPRPWARSWPEPVINIGANNPKEIFHELGHLWEDGNPEVLKAAVEFRDSRKSSEGAQKLKNGFGSDERAYPGNFINPYMGKVNPDGSTEVISMGIQHFSSASEMAVLRRGDPEMYNMMIGLILYQRGKNG